MLATGHFSLSVAALLAHSERALLVSCLGRAVDTFFRSNKLAAKEGLYSKLLAHHEQK